LDFDSYLAFRILDAWTLTTTYFGVPFFVPTAHIIVLMICIFSFESCFQGTSNCRTPCGSEHASFSVRCLDIVIKCDTCLGGNGNFYFDTRFQTDACDLLDNFAGRVQVDQPLVHLELISVPGLGTLAARRLAGGDLEDLGRQTNRPFDPKLLILGAINEIGGEFLQVLDVAAGQCDTDFVDLSSRDSACGIELLFALSDVTHSDILKEKEE